MEKFHPSIKHLKKCKKKEKKMESVTFRCILFTVSESRSINEDAGGVIGAIIFFACTQIAHNWVCKQPNMRPATKEEEAQAWKDFDSKSGWTFNFNSKPDPNADFFDPKSGSFVIKKTPKDDQ